MDRHVQHNTRKAHMVVHAGNVARMHVTPYFEVIKFVCVDLFNFVGCIPFERYMKTLKGFVRNQSRPEGCIAEHYLGEECNLFYKNCVQGSTRLDDNQHWNEEFNNDIILEGHPISTRKFVISVLFKLVFKVIFSVLFKFASSKSLLSYPQVLKEADIIHWHPFVFQFVMDFGTRIIGKTSNDEELNKLKLDNISSMPNWNDFIKHKTNTTFKAKSKKFKDMKQKQLPHTCSRRGYARLAEDLKNSSSSTSIIRVDVWTKARVKKDGTPINSQVADTLEHIEQNRVASSSSIIVDAISKVLGPDQGYVRGLGFGVTLSKVSTSIHKDKTIASLEKKIDNLTSDVDELKIVVASLLKDKEKTSDDNSNHLVRRVPSSTYIRTPTPTPIINSPLSVTFNTPHKCLLLDWVGSGEVIVEGRWSSNDPYVLVHRIPLGPNAIRVWVDTVKIPNSFLWRLTSDIIVIDDALGTTVA
ncbi:Plant transposase [Cucumis melo var. makuwa]|uniref:Plant transposase n=1 Tax=Cucumis melo var. makuwa TaxID=1194695 RepID=A0A5A7T3D8_CUCMM|nr:Plant transposase [Cucumis melo var. makuwa]